MNNLESSSLADKRQKIYSIERKFASLNNNNALTISMKTKLPTIYPMKRVLKLSDSKRLKLLQKQSLSTLENIQQGIDEVVDNCIRKKRDQKIAQILKKLAKFEKKGIAIANRYPKLKHIDMPFFLQSLLLPQLNYIYKKLSKCQSCVPPKDDDIFPPTCRIFPLEKGKL